MKISVIITTYNRANLIERAINSVLSQSFEGFEIVIVDDCSTDNTSDIIGKYTDQRIKYIYLDNNVGAGKAKNIGAENAIGNFVTFLDSDDYYYDESVLGKIFEATSSSDVVAFRKYCIEEGEERNFKESPIHGDIYKYLMEHPLHYIGMPPYAINKNLFEENKGFNVSFRWGEAIALWRKIFQHGAKLKIVEEIGYVMSIHDGERVSKGGNSSRREGKERVFNVVLSTFNEQIEYLNENKRIKAVWLVVLLRLSKSMRSREHFLSILKEILKNGISNHLFGYYLLKSRKITEG